MRPFASNSTVCRNSNGTGLSLISLRRLLAKSRNDLSRSVICSIEHTPDGQRSFQVQQNGDLLHFTESEDRRVARFKAADANRVRAACSARASNRAGDGDYRVSASRSRTGVPPVIAPRGDRELSCRRGPPWAAPASWSVKRTSWKPPHPHLRRAHGTPESRACGGWAGPVPEQSVFAHDLVR